MRSSRSVMTNMRQNCGSTDLRLDRQMLSWDIRGVEGLFETKLLPVWKVESPPFETDNGRRRWHMELLQSKSDLLKCILVLENLEEGESPLLDKNPTVSLKDGEMLNAAGVMEVLTGAVVNSVHVIKTDGRHECFSDILAKYEEANGWKDWAQKFVEKRRKDGITEYIFGRDIEAYENALPISFIMENKQVYIGPDGVLHLYVELLFTSTVKVWNSFTPEGDIQLEKQVQLNNLNIAKKLAMHFKSSKHSDLIVECHGRMFNVHKILLEARLPTFYDVLMSRPRVSQCGATLKPVGDEKAEASIEIVPPPALPFVPAQESPGCGGQCGDGSRGTSLISSCGGTCAAAKQTLDCSKEVVMLESICPAILENILHFAYNGTLPDHLDVLTLSQIAHEAKKYSCHELNYISFLRMLNLFRDAPTESKLLVGEALKEVYNNADPSVFEERLLSIGDLKKMYPSAFLYLGMIDRPLTIETQSNRKERTYISESAFYCN